jgi:hypothetical protein
MTPRSCSYFDRISDTSNMVPEQHATRPRYFHQPTGNFDRAPNTGVYGDSAGSGDGVYGTSTSGTGVLGLISSTTGQSATVGSNGGTGNGVYGKLTGSSTRGTDAAVYGNDTATGGGSHYGGYFKTASGAYAVYVDGGLNVDGTLTFGASGGTSCSAGCTSDRRLKKNIDPLRGAIDRLLHLQGKNYEWITPDEHGHSTGTQIGFVAQEVEQVFPRWVGQNKDGFKTLTIPPMEIAALTVESLRTLKSENDELRAEVAVLRADHAKVAMLETDHATVMQLKDELDSLKAGKDPMTGDRGMLWLFGMVFAVGGAVVVTRKQATRHA